MGRSLVRIIFQQFLLLLGFLAFTAVGCGEAQKRHISDRPAEIDSSVELASSPYHSENGWNGRIFIKIDDRAPEQVYEATELAINSWNEAVGRELITLAGRDSVVEINSLYDPLDDSVTNLFYLDNWRTATQKDISVLGTTVWENDFRFDGEAIIKGDIILNAEEYDFQDAASSSIQSGSAKPVVDTETVVLHELGHLLGLNHVNTDTDPESIMHSHALIGEGQFKRELSDGDVSLIQGLYN